ncbi:MAG: hypothetical protein KME60_30710 [Cyanomargarita calcarea GSE-NOS-MK-12-04C]|uniref:Uncharacterized protein n=1 Tax=Cyanomargarita calcarea GSE-NOS-MK-12-04C TaxID=2839659 RepID=A0A951UW62_9CYAN|nr:hypothetical protein [Cyanomargarita calcarea GSE-NOS-MK-12-04C]
MTYKPHIIHFSGHGSTEERLRDAGVECAAIDLSAGGDVVAIFWFEVARLTGH